MDSRAHLLARDELCAQVDDQTYLYFFRCFCGGEKRALDPAGYPLDVQRLFLVLGSSAKLFFFTWAFFGFNSSSLSLLELWNGLYLLPTGLASRCKFLPSSYFKTCDSPFTRPKAQVWMSEPYFAVWSGCIPENISQFLTAKLMHYTLFVLLQSLWRHQYSQRQTRANWP